MTMRAKDILTLSRIVRAKRDAERSTLARAVAEKKRHLEESLRLRAAAKDVFSGNSQVSSGSELMLQQRAVGTLFRQAQASEQNAAQHDQAIDDALTRLRSAERRNETIAHIEKDAAKARSTAKNKADEDMREEYLLARRRR